MQLYFLLNMSHINQATRDKILHLLVNGISFISKMLAKKSGKLDIKY